MLKTKVLIDTKYVNEIVDIHMQTFTGFFLTFLGKGFLKHLYKGFITHNKSNVIGSLDGNKLYGFVAYSEDISQFYKYLLKKSLIPLAWYSFVAFVRKPKVIFKLLRAFKYSESSKQEVAFIQLASIGVLPSTKNKGIGSLLINELKNQIDFKRCEYIKLETDKLNNDAVNAFYIKNGFALNNSYVTHEGREMNEYRYYLRA